MSKWWRGLRESDRPAALFAAGFLVILVAILLTNYPQERPPGSEQPHVDSAARYTFLLVAILAISTVSLWRQTKRLADTAEAQARDTKEAIAAANKANALIRQNLLFMHRPRLVVRDVHSIGCEPGAPMEIKFKIINAGPSTAHIRGSFFAVRHVQDTEDYRSEPPPTVEDENVLSPIDVPPGGVLERSTLPPGWIWQNSYFHEAFNVEAGLYWCGKIVYTDDNGNSRHMGVFRKFSPQTRRFHPIDDGDYEYED